MKPLPQIVADYVAVWNEGDPLVRRRRIAETWLPHGTTCHRLLDARGPAAIENRVASSWEKWLSEGKYVFRARAFSSHHDAVKVEFVLEKRPGGEIEANGLSFLLLDESGRIEHDYQFNPSANDAIGLKDGYVALLKEADPDRRRAALDGMWAEDGCLITREQAHCGRAAITAEIARPPAGFQAQGAEFAAADRAQAHHNVARLRCPIRVPDGTFVGASTELLILDDGGRIRADYRFSEPA